MARTKKSHEKEKQEIKVTENLIALIVPGTDKIGAIHFSEKGHIRKFDITLEFKDRTRVLPEIQMKIFHGASVRSNVSYVESIVGTFGNGEYRIDWRGTDFKAGTRIDFYLLNFNELDKDFLESLFIFFTFERVIIK